MKKERKIFTFNVDNVIDLITNSSSELFVLDGMTKEVIIEMIENVYPDYLLEYEPIKSFDELENDELETYLDYKYDNGIPGFTPDELYDNYDPNNRWSNYLKDDFVAKNRKKIKEMLDSGDSLWFLYSIDENPNREMQEELSSIGQRLHLG